MTPRSLLFRWPTLLLGVILVLAGCATQRVAPPPPGAAYQLPWGAVPVEHWEPKVHVTFQEELRAGVRARFEEQRQRHAGKRVPYRMLAISGGGSRGAYGAGVLSGWSAAGTRPEFEVVTGISTGAIMATFAFLGPAYGDALHVYANLTNEDIYQPRGRLAGLLGASLHDTTPLRQLLAQLIDEDVLDAVAREYARGRRLFVGTTNLDAQAFTIWDLGAIAASTRSDKLDRYREIILASASVPLFFPPVFIPVEADDDEYRQMHVDGGVRQPVFFYDFIEEAEEAFAAVGLSRNDVHAELYVLHNEHLYARGTYSSVKPSSLSIARASIANLRRQNILNSLYRIWVQALIYGFDFHLAFIPPDFPLSQSPLNFDPDEMRRLFERGHSAAVKGKAWYTQRAVSNPEELLRLLDPMEQFAEVEARPPFRRDLE